MEVFNVEAFNGLIGSLRESDRKRFVNQIFLF